MRDVAVLGPAIAPDLQVMTLNVRRRIPHLSPFSPDLWSRRRWSMKRLLAAERPTLLGVQEALPDQVGFLAACLGADYAVIGCGRNADGSGEHCAIYYNTTRLHLGPWEQLALSDTPSVPGSRSFGNPLPRIVVVARFTDRATGSSLTIVNTHLDPFSRRSRIHSVRMLAQLVTAATGEVVVMGDANAAVGSRPYRELLAAAPLHDAWDSATQRRSAAFGTYARYRRPRAGGARIDWLLATHGIHVVSAAINPATFAGRAASDHLPMQAVIRLSNPVNIGPSPS